jgi:hypothetical protein
VSTWKPDPRWVKVPAVHSGNRGALYASVAHRAWFAAFEAFVQGRRQSPPVMNPRECRFGVWLESERLGGQGDSPEFHSIDMLHQRFHEVAGKMLQSQSKENFSEESEGLGALREIYKDLTQQLGAYPHQ